VLVDQDFGNHIFFEEIGIRTELALFVGGLFIAGRVHERIGVVGGIEKLHVAFIEGRIFESFAGTEGAVQDVTGEVAF
jgi:hypothetical protein